MEKTKDDYLKEFGARVKRLRLERQMTMEEFASQCGYTNRSAAYTIENGKQDVPLTKVKLMAKVLGVSAYYLQFGEEYQEPTTDVTRDKVDFHVVLPTPEESKEWVEVSKNEINLLVEFRKLSPEEQDLFIKIMKK